MYAYFHSAAANVGIHTQPPLGRTFYRILFNDADPDITLYLE